MFSNTQQNKELYIPDFKLWADYYQKQASGQRASEHTSHHSTPTLSSDDSKVQVKLVSPIAQTTDQAESIMKTDGQVTRKTKKNKKQKSKSKSKGNKTHGRKKSAATKKSAASGKQTFSVRKLKDIFSNGKK